MVVLVRCFATLLMGLPVYLMFQLPSEALTRIESRHGAWAISCTFGKGGADVCGITNRNRAFMDRVRVQFLVLKGSRRGNAVLRLSAPVSVKRDSGAVLVIDKQNFGVLPFVDCNKEGCVAQASLSSAKLQRLFSGDEVSVFMEAASGRTFRMRVPLRGFGEAFDTLP